MKIVSKNLNKQSRRSISGRPTGRTWRLEEMGLPQKGGDDK